MSIFDVLGFGRDVVSGLVLFLFFKLFFDYGYIFISSEAGFEFVFEGSCVGCFYSVG